MSSSIGNNIRVTIFGESHSAAVGMVMEGLPPGEKVDMDALRAFMKRRAPGRSELTTQRKEPDEPEILSGIKDGVTCGTPVCVMIRNLDTRPSDYDEIKNIPRPGHADYTSYVRYGGFNDYRGGGHSSGRLTAALCAAGGIALQILERRGVTIRANITEIGGFDIDEDTAAASEALDKAKAEGNSLGGIIECEASGVPAGIGDPIFNGMENDIAKAVFGIPAIKGIEFGAGFRAAAMTGSENNDDFFFDQEGCVRTLINNHGGILGGITSGETIVFRAAVKPTPSIAKEQRSVNLATGENVSIRVKGRHDPCIALRACPCVEAAAAIVILDHMAERNKL